ncbi:MAG: YraN family protein [Candidatus Eremiobacteraeota bacterium]|nr:YraN family protein [Candidatus Eremiobacteraeota bacterium]
MPRNNGAKGRDGETRAAAFLTAFGYQVVDRNVRVPGGEIDLVCRDGDTIVLVEVKARAGRSFGSALSGVGTKKRATLRKVAADYLQIVAPNSPYRFDIVAIDSDRISLHRNAF